MSELDEIGIRGIPKGSKLMLLGDWYRRPGNNWRVVCYFYSKHLGYFRKALPIDLLPTLILGNLFPRTISENEAKGWTGILKLPNQSKWQKLHYSNLPDSLQRAADFSEQFDNGFIYRLEEGNRIYWIPLSELARMLFFQSSEVTRAAVYHGNIWQLGKAIDEDWTGEIKLSSAIPVRYLNSLQFRKFFTWLFFIPEAEQSFSSIFTQLNRSRIDIDGAERWSFDFSPPNLNNCEISYAGFTGKELEKHHVFIREIRSISGITSPDLNTIYFSHPDDDIILQNEEEDIESNKNKKQPQDLNVDIKEILPDLRPNPRKKRFLLKIGNSGLNFDVEPDLKRSPRHLRGLPAGTKPELDEIEEQPVEEQASLNEVSETGKIPRADIDNLDPPDLIDAPEKLAFFQDMLQKLEKDYGWHINMQLGDVPKMSCRSLHLINGHPRQYCHGIIQRDETTTVQVLEIELTTKESLSTLFFREDDKNSTYLEILDELMSRYQDEGLNAMSWKRKFNSESTQVSTYLGHPDNKIKNEDDALNSWTARAAGKILNI
ncbi:hypothetical protein [Terasakiella pusilla]|uniref:hypothetical protein n=1 Tax=Terasakiella pusilla TaxID=64973 RepID=UPI00048D725D|nr:hypothetical protein [Terasakiella pusilla]